MVRISVMLDNRARFPRKAHHYDAGYDIFTPCDIDVPAHGSAVIDTGVHMLIPEGYVGMIKSKSGLNVKADLTNEGVIDAGYTGSIVVKMYNNGDITHHFSEGDKITQIVILPVPDVQMMQVDEMPQTERGDRGFGSTGK